MKLIGIDPAWNGVKNTSGVAYGALKDRKLTLPHLDMFILAGGEDYGF